jgi:hypothetical protein
MPGYVEWFVLGVVAGLLLPWLIHTSMLLSAFRRGLRAGLETWLGLCWYSVFVVLATMFVVRFVVDQINS